MTSESAKPAQPFDPTKLVEGWVEVSKSLHAFAADYGARLHEWAQSPSAQYCLAWSRYYQEHPEELAALRGRYGSGETPR